MNFARGKLYKWNRPNKKPKKIDSMITDECGNALLSHSHLQVEAKRSAEATQ